MTEVSQKEAEIPAPPLIAEKPEKKGFFSKKDSNEIQLKEKEKALAEKEKILAKIEKEIASKKIKLNEQEDYILTKKEATDNKEKALNEKENELADLNKELSRQVKDLDKDKAGLVREIETLEKKRDALRATVYETEQWAKKLKRELEDKETLFREKERQIGKKAEEIANKEVKITRTDLKDKEIEMGFKARENAVQLAEKEFERTRKEATDNVRLLEQKQKDLMNDVIKLSADKRNVEHNVFVTSNELEKLKIEYETKLNVLKTNQQILDEKEDEIVKKFNEIESDRKRIDSTEKKLVADISRIEKDKKELDEKEDEITGMFTKFETAQKMLNNREKEVSKREEKVKKAKELKANLPLLEKKYRQLMSEVQKKQKIVNRAGDIMQRERVIKEKEGKIEGIMQGVEKEKEKVDELSFRSYLKNELKRYETDLTEEKGIDGDISFAERLVEEESPEGVEIYELMDRAREAMKVRNVKEAKQIYDQIKSAYSLLRGIDAEQKKKIYYDVIGLKTDIELAGLA